MDHLMWLAIWARSCSEFIPQLSVRKKALQDFTEQPFGELRLIFFSVAAAKVHGRRTWRPALDVWGACVGEQKVLWATYFPLFALPAWVYRLIRSSYHSQRKLLGRDDPEKPAIDPFRF
jgi:hypothetical protein